MNPQAPVPETPERRAALTLEVTARTGLDTAALERLLRTFYGAARQDPLLAPAFAGVTDWEAHIANLTRFWSSVALLTGAYHGQPLPAHRPLGLAPKHFARWLALFEATATECCSPAGAAHLIERARRIARSLELSLTPLPLPLGRPAHVAGAPTPPQPRPAQ